MKNMVFVLVLSLMLGAYGCSPEKHGPASDSGVGVVFDGVPLIFDSSVVFMGSSVGQILDSQWKNGVTRLTISLDNNSQSLQQSNMVAVVKNGRLNLVALNGVGEPLSPSICILGFKNNYGLQWFRFINLINNINMAAAHKAYWLSALSGLSG